MTDKLEVEGALILTPSIHQCSVLRVFQASQSYPERIEVETKGTVSRNLPKFNDGENCHQIE